MERSQVSVVVLRTIFTWPVQTNRCELPSIRPLSQSTKTGFSGVAIGVRTFGSIGEVGGFQEGLAVGFAVAGFEGAGFGASGLGPHRRGRREEQQEASRAEGRSAAHRPAPHSALTRLCIRSNSYRSSRRWRSKACARSQ